MGMRPLPEPAPEPIEPALDEPKLELLPALDDAEAVAAADDEPSEEDVAALEEAATETQDPLKLYVRQIGDGRLLTRAEERALARR